MSEQMPDRFTSDEELVEWFEHADLSQYQLDRALEVVVASRVTLSIEEELTPGASTTGAAAPSTFELVG